MVLIRWVLWCYGLMYLFLLSSFLQVTKATGKFLRWSHTGSYNFSDWNNWRERDGLLCRTSTDCTWLDGNLQCLKHGTLDTTNISSAWFGGNASIVGKCQCGPGLGWDEEELECSWNSAMTTLFWSLACIGMILLSVLCRLYKMNNK